MAKEDIVVLATPFELLRVCEGNAVRFISTDGQDVTVRLPTLSEAVDMHEAACRKIGVEPSMSIEQAKRIIAPVRFQ